MTFWPKPLIIVAIIGIAWVVPALILTSQLFSSVQAQEYTPVLRQGKYGVSDSGFKCPEGIAVGQQGNVYVADIGSNRIAAYAP